MAQVKLLKIATGRATEHDGTADDLTVLSMTTDTVNERTGAAGVTIDGVLLKDSGATCGANVVMGDFSITGIDTLTFTDVNGTIAGIQNQNLLDKSAAETITALYTHSIADGATVTSTNVLKLEHTTSGTAGTAFGADIAFYLEDSAGNSDAAASLNVVWADATSTSEDADFVFLAMTAGSAKAEVARITSLGNITATSIGGITEGNLVDKSAAESITGSWDFGGAGSLEIPNGAAPTVDAAGEIAIDTTITSHDGQIIYYDGTNELFVPAVRVADRTTTDGHVIAYNSASSKFVMQSQAGGSTEAYTNGNAGALAKGDVVYLEAGVNDTVEIADADTIAHGVTIVGIANETINAAASGEIFVTKGKVVTGILSSATAGTVYYLSTAGTTGNTLTTTPPSGGPALVKIGYAKNATDLVYDPLFIADTTA